MIETVGEVPIIDITIILPHYCDLLERCVLSMDPLGSRSDVRVRWEQNHMGDLGWCMEARFILRDSVGVLLRSADTHIASIQEEEFQKSVNKYRSEEINAKKSCQNVRRLLHRLNRGAIIVATGVRCSVAYLPLETLNLNH